MKLRVCLLAVLVAVLLGTVPSQAQQGFVVIQPSQVSGVAATTLTRNTVQLAPAGTQSTVAILINITASGTATGTLQIWIQDSVDGGTTWDDLVSSNTFALGAATTTQRFFIAGDVIPSSIATATATNLTQGSAVANETMAVATARQGPFGDRLRVREKITGPSGSPVGATYTITAVFK
jgi:hypothetical protein